MSPYQKKQQDKRRKNLFRKLHRWIGFSSAIFLLNLAITGILLNHSDDLQLHKVYVNSSWLTNWYGVNAPENFDCVRQQKVKTLICQVDSKLYRGSSSLIEIEGALLGVIEIDKLIYISTTKTIYILTKNFELVENIDLTNGLPNLISKLGFVLSNNHKQLSIEIKDKVWVLNPIDNSWKLTEQAFQPVNSLTKSNKELSEQLRLIYLNHQISYLKLVQDIHSGRILDLSGKLLTDLSGIIIILLSISGFIAWQRRTKQ